MFSAAKLLAKTIWKSKTFHPHFAKFSTFESYFSGFIGVTGILSRHNFPLGARLNFGVRNFPKFFPAEELLAKVKCK